MPLVVLIVLLILGYVTVGIVTGTVVAFTDNRQHGEAMTDSDAALLAFFSLLWPVMWVYGGVCAVFWCVAHGISGMYGAYQRYLRDLGAPKQLP